MKTQLNDRYLKNNHCHHGLYLVGWFNCDQWDEEDYRKTEASRLSLQETKQGLAGQAKALSSDGIHIEVLILDASFI